LLWRRFPCPPLQKAHRSVSCRLGDESDRPAAPDRALIRQDQMSGLVPVGFPGRSSTRFRGRRTLAPSGGGRQSAQKPKPARRRNFGQVFAGVMWKYIPDLPEKQTKGLRCRAKKFASECGQGGVLPRGSSSGCSCFFSLLLDGIRYTYRDGGGGRKMLVEWVVGWGFRPWCAHQGRKLANCLRAPTK